MMALWITVGICIGLCFLFAFLALKTDWEFLFYVGIVFGVAGILFLAKNLELNSYVDYHVKEIAEKYTIVVIKNERTVEKIYHVAIEDVNSNITYVVEVNEDKLSLYENEYFRCHRYEFIDSYEKVVSKTYNYNN